MKFQNAMHVDADSDAAAAATCTGSQSGSHCDILNVGINVICKSKSAVHYASHTHTCCA